MNENRQILISKLFVKGYAAVLKVLQQSIVAMLETNEEVKSLSKRSENLPKKKKEIEDMKDQNGYFKSEKSNIQN